MLLKILGVIILEAEICQKQDPRPSNGLMRPAETPNNPLVMVFKSLETLLAKYDLSFNDNRET